MAGGNSATKDINPDNAVNELANQDEVFRSVSRHVEAMDLADADEEEDYEDDDPKVVEEIESLCMNCKENVWNSTNDTYTTKHGVTDLLSCHRGPHDSCSQKYHSFVRSF